jgi:hypothetical protein
VTSFEPASTGGGSTSRRYLLVFSEQVVGLRTGDFTIGGTAKGWVLSRLALVSGATYELIVDGSGGAPGTLTVTLAANSVADPAGNVGPASPASTDPVSVP